MAEKTKKSKRTSGTVLIVDDEAMICETLGLLLSRRSIDFKSVLTGAEAIKFIETEGASLVILDFSLPDINGLEVLEKIREIEPDLPVIFMTGYGSETVSIRAFKLGISDYFIKPFTPKNLVLRVLDLIKSNIKIDDAEIEDIKNPPEIENATGISKVLDHVKNKYQDHLSLDEAANIAGISRYHFTRAFKKVMGISFSDYLSHLRVKKSEEFLSISNASVSQAAYKAGFNSLRQFERAFKKVTGETPLQYRKKKSSAGRI